MDQKLKGKKILVIKISRLLRPEWIKMNLSDRLTLEQKNKSLISIK